MANLFDYATKELSQDAFLRWLFESWKDEDVAPCVYNLVGKFCGIDEGAEITEMKTRAQWEKIDIEVDFLANGERYLLYIEDKTWSEAHNQLEKYSVAILEKARKENIKEKNIKKLFYKTYWISEQDKSETKDNDWTPYDIDAIYKLLAPFSESKNMILSQYIAHIAGIYNALHNAQKPQDNTSENLLKWEGYFNNIAKKIIEKHGYQNSGAWRAGPYPYICLVLRKNDSFPYIEIRSRDYANGKFTAYILLYELEKRLKLSPDEFEKYRKGLRILIENKKESGLFQVQNYKRQVARYTSDREISTDEDFIGEIEKCAQYYDELIELWEAQLKK